jgi:hypothetical protein
LNAGLDRFKSADDPHFRGSSPEPVEFFVRHLQDGNHVLMHLAGRRREMIDQGSKQVENDRLEFHEFMVSETVPGAVNTNTV